MNYYNNNSNNNKIDRPYADLDLSKLRWDQVMQIMQKQAMAARIQMMAKYQMPPPPVPPIVHPHPQQQQPQQPQIMTPELLPVHISCDYQDMPFNYSTKMEMNGNPNSNSEESDSSSCCSSRSMSCSPTTSESSESETEMENESDIEIDVEDCSDDNIENDEYYLMSSLDNIPLTVIQLENKLRGNNEKS